MDKKSKVIIIGNSPEILDYEYGSYIDSFDTVIRINHCPTAGYEKNIGSRTDIWATTHHYFHPNFWPNWANLQQVWTRTPTVKVKVPTDFSKHKMHFMTMYKTSAWKTHKTPSGTKFIEICKPLNHEPCTGLITILTSTLWEWDITIHGFTFYTESDGETTGYYREDELDADGNHPEDKYWLANKKKGFSSAEEGKKKLDIIKALQSDGLIKTIDE